MKILFIILGILWMLISIVWISTGNGNLEPWTVLIGAVVFVLGLFFPTKKADDSIPAQKVKVGINNQQAIKSNSGIKGLLQSVFFGYNNTQSIDIGTNHESEPINVDKALSGKNKSSTQGIILELIKNDELLLAIQEMEAQYDEDVLDKSDLIGFQRRLNVLTTKTNKRTIHNEEASIERNSIADALLQILKEIDG